MKYPWVAISLIIIWFSTTYIVLKGVNLNTNFILWSSIAGTIIIAFIGFRPPKLPK